jgi:L-ascorbate metabolism protein UlaG (beta-lactamase superfamily)
VRAHGGRVGFNNLHAANHRADSPIFWLWQWERLRDGRAEDALHRVRSVPPDLARPHANRGDVTVTWIGHATVLWQIGGPNRPHRPALPRARLAGALRGAAAPGAPAHPAGRAAAHRRGGAQPQSLRPPRSGHRPRAGGAARRAPLFVLPPGVDLWMRDEGIGNVRRMDWWDRIALAGPAGEVVVHFVPVQHRSSRTPWDGHATLWGGFVVEGRVGARPCRTRFAGLDFALVPVGCCEPRWFHAGMHVDEDGAVRIHLEVRSRLSLGIHWGAFRLCDEPVHSPLDGLPRARARHRVPDEAFVLFRQGETILRGATSSRPFAGSDP